MRFGTSGLLYPAKILVHIIALLRFNRPHVVDITLAVRDGLPIVAEAFFVLDVHSVIDLSTLLFNGEDGPPNLFDCCGCLFACLLFGGCLHPAVHDSAARGLKILRTW